jgi:probable rRNA maturation factor
MPTAVQVEINIQDFFFEPSSEAVPIDLNTWESWFQRWLEELQPSLPPQMQNSSYELSLRLTNDAEIQHFNAQYCQKDQPTDVLAFAALEAEPLPAAVQADLPLYLGDILISVETAQNQAEHGLKQELAWLAAHALLHLLGWDHPDELSLQKMLQQQESLLQTVGLTSRYHQEALSPLVELNSFP